MVRVILILAILVIGGCNQTPQSDQYQFVEYLRVEGECYEDHVKQRAHYTGQLVHWHNKAKNVHSRHGSVHHFAGMAPEKMIEAIKNQYKYQPPFTISFANIPAEQFSSDNLNLNGISEHLGKDGEGGGSKYRASCALKVTKRLDHIPPMDEQIPRIGEPNAS